VRGLFGLGAFVAALLLLGGAATAAERLSCAPHGSRVIAAAGLARLYVRQMVVVTACRPDGTRAELGWLPNDEPSGSSGYDQIDRLRLQPRWVAWAYLQHDGISNDTYYSVNVRRLTPGAKTVSRPTGHEGCAPACPSFRGVGPAVQLALDTHGDTAWIAQTPTGYELWVGPTGRHARRLAIGADISPTKLTITRARGVRWRQAGRIRTAPLGPLPPLP
jgi:hypothetical protein